MLNPVGNMTSARSKKQAQCQQSFPLFSSFFCFCTRMPVRGLLVFCQTSRGKEKEETERRTGKKKGRGQEKERNRKETRKKGKKNTKGKRHEGTKESMCGLGLIITANFPLRYGWGHWEGTETDRNIAEIQCKRKPRKGQLYQNRCTTATDKTAQLYLALGETNCAFLPDRPNIAETRRKQ